MTSQTMPTSAACSQQPVGSPPPLLTLEKSITPPEAPSAVHDATDEAARVIEYADAEFQQVRFDLPEPDTNARFDDLPPIQLERRGLTSHAPVSPTKSKVPHWQPEFWAVQTVFKNAVAAKLREAGRETLAETLEDCHSTYTVAQCGDCGAVRRFPNRCDNHFCPECQPRLAGERRKAVEWWTHLVCQPKHVVLTVRNVPALTKGHVLEFKLWWGKLRRRKFANGWLGGFYSLEVTNEGRGWHLHLHALIDAKWIDAGQLAQEWNKVTNGLGNIVCVKDARAKNYLAEVTKYAVKGNQLAQWAGTDIAMFIDAFEGVRTFGVFGSLYGARTKFREFIDSLRDAKPKCDCGSCNIRYWSEAEWLLMDLRPQLVTKPRPPSVDTQQQTLFGTHLAPHEVKA